MGLWWSPAGRGRGSAVAGPAATVVDVETAVSADIAAGIRGAQLDEYADILVSLRLRRVDRGPGAFLQVAPEESSDEEIYRTSAEFCLTDLPETVAAMAVLPDVPWPAKWAELSYREALLQIMHTARLLLADFNPNTVACYRHAWQQEAHMWETWLQEFAESFQ